MGRCCVLRCKAPSRIRVHKFPKNDIELMVKWLKLVEREDLLLTLTPEAIYKHHYVCDIHFSDDEKFETSTCTKLKHGSLPTLNINETINIEDALNRQVAVEYLTASEVDSICGNWNQETQLVPNSSNLLLQTISSNKLRSYHQLCSPLIQQNAISSKPQIFSSKPVLTQKTNEQVVKGNGLQANENVLQKVTKEEAMQHLFQNISEQNLQAKKHPTHLITSQTNLQPKILEQEVQAMVPKTTTTGANHPIQQLEPYLLEVQKFSYASPESLKSKEAPQVAQTNIIGKKLQSEATRHTQQEKNLQTNTLHIETNLNKSEESIKSKNAIKITEQRILRKITREEAVKHILQEKLISNTAQIQSNTTQIQTSTTQIQNHLNTSEANESVSQEVTEPKVFRKVSKEEVMKHISQIKLARKLRKIKFNNSVDTKTSQSSIKGKEPRQVKEPKVFRRVSKEEVIKHIRQTKLAKKLQMDKSNNRMHAKKSQSSINSKELQQVPKTQPKVVKENELTTKPSQSSIIGENSQRVPEIQPKVVQEEELTTKPSQSCIIGEKPQQVAVPQAKVVKEDALTTKPSQSSMIGEKPQRVPGTQTKVVKEDELTTKPSQSRIIDKKLQRVLGTQGKVGKKDKFTKTMLQKRLRKIFKQNVSQLGKECASQEIVQPKILQKVTKEEVIKHISEINKEQVIPEIRETANILKVQSKQIILQKVDATKTISQDKPTTEDEGMPSEMLQDIEIKEERLSPTLNNACDGAGSLCNPSDLTAKSLNITNLHSTKNKVKNKTIFSTTEDIITTTVNNTETTKSAKTMHSNSKDNLIGKSIQISLPSRDSKKGEKVTLTCVPLSSLMKNLTTSGIQLKDKFSVKPIISTAPSKSIPLTTVATSPMQTNTNKTIYETVPIKSCNKPPIINIQNKPTIIKNQNTPAIIKNSMNSKCIKSQEQSILTNTPTPANNDSQNKSSNINSRNKPAILRSSSSTTPMKIPNPAYTERQNKPAILRSSSWTTVKKTPNPANNDSQNNPSIVKGQKKRTILRSATSTAIINTPNSTNNESQDKLSSVKNQNKPAIIRSSSSTMQSYIIKSRNQLAILKSPTKSTFVKSQDQILTNTPSPTSKESQNKHFVVKNQNKSAILKNLADTTTLATSQIQPVQVETSTKPADDESQKNPFIIKSHDKKQTIHINPTNSTTIKSQNQPNLVQPSNHTIKENQQLQTPEIPKLKVIKIQPPSFQNNVNELKTNTTKNNAHQNVQIFETPMPTLIKFPQQSHNNFKQSLDAPLPTLRKFQQQNHNNFKRSLETPIPKLVKIQQPIIQSNLQTNTIRNNVQPVLKDQSTQTSENPIAKLVNIQQQILQNINKLPVKQPEVNLTNYTPLNDMDIDTLQTKLIPNDTVSEPPEKVRILSDSNTPKVVLKQAKELSTKPDENYEIYIDPSVMEAPIIQALMKQKLAQAKERKTNKEFYATNQSLAPTSTGSTLLQSIGINKVSQLDPKSQRIHQEYRTLKRRFATTQKRITKLKENLSGLKSIANDLKKLEKVPKLRNFVMNQMLNSDKLNIARQYNLDDKLFALSLYLRDPHYYSYLETYFMLPKARMLKNLITKIRIAPGILEGVIKIIEILMQELNTHERLGILAYQELLIKPRLDYDEENDRISGFSDNGTNRSQDLANYIQIYMLMGLHGNWRYIVGYNCCTSTMRVDGIANFVQEIVRRSNEIDLRIVSVVNDYNSITVAAMGHLQRCTGILDEIIPIYEPNKLIKYIRNLLITNDIKFKHRALYKVASWSDILLAYSIDSERQAPYNFLPKLTANHVNAKKMDKNKNSICYQIFSLSMAKAINHYTELNSFNKSGQQFNENSYGTRDFCQLMNDFCDSLKAEFVVESNVPNLMRIVTNKSWHLKFWSEAAQVVNTFEFLSDNYSKRLAIAQHLKLTIDGLSNIATLILNRLEFRSFPTKHINHEPLDYFVKFVYDNVKDKKIDLTCTNFLATLTHYMGLYFFTTGNKSCCYKIVRCLEKFKKILSEKELIKKDVTIPTYYEIPQVTVNKQDMQDSLRVIFTFLDENVPNNYTDCEDCTLNYKPSDDDYSDIKSLDLTDCENILQYNKRLLDVLFHIHKFCLTMLPDILHEFDIIVKIKLILTKEIDFSNFKNCKHMERMQREMIADLPKTILKNYIEDLNKMIGTVSNTIPDYEESQERVADYFKDNLY